MSLNRLPILVLGGAALFTAAVAWMPVAASACDGAKEACAACSDAAAKDPAAAGSCGGEEAKPGDANKAGGEHKACGCGGGGEHASCGCGKGGGEKGACACGGGGGGGAEHGSCGDAKPETKAGGANQQAVIDPATGELIEPSDDQAAAVDPGSASPRAAAPREVAQPNGGVMAAFPKDCTSRAVATVDPTGKAHASCSDAGQ